jgi:hypothetical protein
LSDKQTTGYSEGIVGVRVKRFLGLSVMHLASELLKQTKSSESEEIIETIILPLLKQTFSLSSGDNPESQAKTFLASLGFSPCEISWQEDTRIGNILLGRGRIWRSTTEKEEKLVKRLILTVVKGLGSAFMNSNIQVSFISSEILSPRFTYEIQFRATEDVFAESIGTSEDTPGVSLSLKVLLEPILGSGIRSRDAARFLIEATQKAAGKYLPSLLERVDIKDKPLKLLELFYLNIEDSELLLKYAHEIGEDMIRSIRIEFPELKNHQLLKGIGLLPVEEIDELLFYGSAEICGTGVRGSNMSFCQFLGQMWGGFASEVLGKEFRMMEDPLCAGSKGTRCIFTISEIKGN